jgi:hypothetical protein
MWQLFGAFMLVTGLMFVGAQAIVGGARLGSQNFLAGYEAMMPGQPTAGLADTPCQLRVGMSKGVEVGMCQFQAEDAIFGRVTVVSANRIVTRLAFEVQPEALHLGDLVLCWGQPDSNRALPESAPNSQITTRWQNRIFAGHAAPQSGQRNYFVSLTYLSLEKEMMQCEIET